MFNSTEKFFIEPVEECVILEDNLDVSLNSEIKIRIPKLMPLLPKIDAQDYKRIYGTNIFVNSSTTKPKPKGNIICSNYMIVSKISKSITSCSKGDTGLVRIISKNIDNIALIDMYHGGDK